MGALVFLYEDFSSNLVTEDKLNDIIERSVLICINNDLLLPPFAQVKDVTLHQKQSMVAASGYPTGKRLGYLFNSEQQNGALPV